tara:strand:+ start:503 stop:712 length:210 start_codon:yes stop_codon:yes gene_type:complete
MFFKKEVKETEKWKELVALLELMKTTLAEHTAQISLINDKLIKKFKPKQDETQTKDIIYDDGFNSLRGL